MKIHLILGTWYFGTAEVYRQFLEIKESSHHGDWPEQCYVLQMFADISPACEPVKDGLSLPHFIHTGHVARRERSLGSPGILLFMAYPCLKTPQGRKLHRIALFLKVVTSMKSLQTLNEPTLSYGSYGKYRVRFLQTTGHKSNPSIHSLLFRGFLFKNTVFNTHY